MEGMIIFSPKSEDCLLECSSTKSINWVINAGVCGNYHIHKHSVYLIGKNPKLKCFLDHFIYKQTETCGCC